MYPCSTSKVWLAQWIPIMHRRRRHHIGDLVNAHDPQRHVRAYPLGSKGGMHVFVFNIWGEPLCSRFIAHPHQHNGS